MRSLLLAADMLVLLGMSMRWPFVGVLLWSWISFMNPHQLAWGFASGVPWAMMTFIATLIGCVVAREPRRLPITGVTAMMLAFMLAISATTAVAQSPLPEATQKYIWAIKVFTVLLLSVALLTSRRRIQALVWVMVLSLAFFGVKGGAYTILSGGGARIFGPPSTMIEDNNHLAVGLLVTLPLMNFLRLQSAHRIVRAGLAASMVLTLFAVVGSYSRGALIALAAVAVLFWLKSRRKLLYGALVSGLVAGAVSFMPQGWTERMHTIQSYEQDNSAEARLTMWHTAWLLAKARPLVGSGFYGPYTRVVVDQVDPASPARAVHSIWFETLGEHGFPTFFIWAGMTVAGALASRRIVRAARDRPELAWCADLARMAQVSMVAYLVGGTFLSLCYWDFYFTLLGVVTAVDVYVRRAVSGTLAAPAPARWVPRAAPQMAAR
ncbi:MAG TPA: putative O-glycosylation ligase, exosortase A system-associated [Acetobacteraceae bacterium]|nr:putative O-glycosylation ligase, exosortase A system-associated [Acetobacteraceae bacterium]